MSDLSTLPQDQILGGNRYDEQPQRLSDMPADEEGETSVLVVGGGPVGMLLAYILSAYWGVECMLVEQASETTRYPKMEYSNHRSMEIYHRLGVADQLRSMGVDPESDLRELIATGLGEKGKLLTTWERPSPAEVERETTQKNDGTGPRETYVRCHQIPIEKWLKGLAESQSKCQSRWNCKFVGLEEGNDVVTSELETADGKKIRVRSKYVVGCDGAGSLVRKSIGKESKRTDLNLDFLFIFFKSRDPVFRSLGRYWHCNLLNGGLIVDQSNDMWTLHYAVPPGGELDPSNIEPESFISETLGGMEGPVPVKIDEVYVKGKWGSRVAIADSFRSDKGRVFLAGDSAHQLSPVGGHGLNTGIGDVWDISWKLAAVLEGWGGPGLLQSYDAERRPVAHSNLANVMRATGEVAAPMFGAAREFGDLLIADTPEGEAKRREVAQVLDGGHWLHNQQGKILGLRYNHSPIIAHELDGKEPPHNTTDYFPSTWPGVRPPHVLVEHGKTAIFDLFGKGYTLICFTDDQELANRFAAAAQKTNTPLDVVRLPNEANARRLWERDAVLIRPDGHVAWRLSEAASSENGKSIDVEGVLKYVSGS